ncbi:uncharacterized protein [Onthophagus taurus]|uniref:uncharacterized protein isoform X1 n=1 Tax=Onthophagus taurus TaxID=166361 RepID=UPI0039BDF187
MNTSEKLQQIRPDFIIKSNIEYTDVIDADELKKDNIESIMFSNNIRTLGSEKSYEQLLSDEQLYDSMTFFTFTPTWLYFCSSASFALFWIVTYNVSFDKNFEDKVIVLWIKLVCNTLVIIDILGAYVHLRWKEIRLRAVYKPRPVFFMICDVLSLSAIPMGLIKPLRSIFYLRLIEIAFLLARHYRIYYYFQTVSSNAGSNTMCNLALKHSLVFAFIFHAFSCFWFYLGCYKCKNKKTLTWVDKDSYLQAVVNQYEPSAFQLYILSMLHVIGGVTCVALGSGSTEQNEAEKVTLIIFMSISLYYLNGVVIGTFTNVCCNNYVRQTQFTDKFKMIVSNMRSHNISKSFINKMLDYYIHYWRQEDAINQSKLFDSLPLAFRQICLLDKYWFTLSQSHLFSNLEDGFKRSVACRMTTKMCVPDEVIADVENPRDCMMYIAKGSVHLLSVVDGESSLITLGVGTCLGEINLIYGIKNSTKVIAATYCTIFILGKAKMWMEMVHFRQMKQSAIFHHNSQSLIDFARRTIQEKREAYEGDTPLQKIKTTLQNEDDVRLLDYTKIYTMSYQRKLSDVYVLSRSSNVFSDGIFLNTSWPWILNSQSAFWSVWEMIIIIIIATECVGYPLEIAYYRRFSSGYGSIYRIFGDTIYLVDFVLKMFTSVETEEGIYTTVIEIILQRLATFSFLLDLLAIFPISSLVAACGITQNERMLTLISVHKLVKVYRLVVFMIKLEYNFRLNVSYVRLVKYVLYLLYFAYMFGCMYYVVLCFEEPCYPTMALGNKTEDQFTSAVMTAMLIMSGTGGVVDFFSFEEIVVILMISVMGTLTVVYLISDYSSTLTLASSEATIFIEMINLIRGFMDSNKISKNIVYRINQYFVAKWLECKGVDFNALYDDAPSQLYEDFQSRKYSKLLSSAPVFRHLNYHIIKRLAMSCQIISLPPKEYVTYAGEVQKDMYIIEKGFCEMISGSSQKVDKILGPLGNFCDIETLLAVPAIFNVKTITHVSLVKIRCTAIKEAFLMNTEIDKQLTDVIDDTKNSFAAKRLFTQTTTNIEEEDIEEHEKSWFIFPKSIVHPIHIDFLLGWQNMNVLRYILLRRTIMPYGQFICFWELSRGIFAFISAILHPTLHVYQCYTNNIKWVALALDILAAIDIYVRMHMCYYDKHGILVTHPRLTAINYFTSSFLLDFLAMFPTDYLIFFVEGKDIVQFNTVQAFVRLNRVLQIYRLPDSFRIFSKDIFDQGGIMVIAIKYLLLTLVILNTLAIIIVNNSIEIRDQTDGLKKITPIPDTWISSSETSFSFDNSLPINTYMIAFYWVTTTAQQLSFGNVIPHNDKEVIFVIFIIVIGYMWFTFVIVIISNNKATINEHLTLYQNHMKRLITYMRQEKISKNLQTLAIDHFEHIWKRTQGMNANTILQSCHLALRKDCALFLYGETFSMVPVFTDMKSSFFRILGTNIDVFYFLKNHTIISLNDMVKSVYIVHKGYVVVIGPDGRQMETLSRGCVFGNIDDIETSRSMVMIIAGSNTDLLTISTLKFYELLDDYPVVKNRINKSMLFNNLSYILVQRKELFTNHKSLTIKKINLPSNRFLKGFLTGRWIQKLFIITSLCSYIIASYQLAFRDYHFMIFVAAYFLDLLHILKMYIEFNAPYQDEVGNLIMDKRLIRSRYLTFSRFYLELAAIVPIELFCFIWSFDRMNIMCILRLNRSLRLWNIFHYFNVTCNFLNINVVSIEIFSIAINMILLTHTEACLLIILGTGTKNIKSGWTYNDEGVAVCDKYYLCALYLAVSFTSFAGYSNMRPRNFQETFLAIFLTLINKLITAMVIGNMSAIAQSYISTLTKYDLRRRKMELYLKHSIISPPLFKAIMKYTHQLWTENQGSQIPMFVKLAPSHLKSHIKYAAYGYHIKENLIFMQCHDSFLHILCKKLKVQMYFTDDIICQRGDVNGTMYFIHRGSVKAYYITEIEEIHVDSLIEKDCFGMVQGLFPNAPHTHTFKATTVTTILSLELKNWAQLLQFYPAAKFSIYEKMSRLDELCKQY